MATWKSTKVLKYAYQVANILPGKAEGRVIQGEGKRKKTEPKRYYSICGKFCVCVLKNLRRRHYVCRHLGVALEY